MINSTFSSGKTETPSRDSRNCELLDSMMTQICSRNRPNRVVKSRMSSYELNPPKQKGVNLEGLEDECQSVEVHTGKLHCNLSRWFCIKFLVLPVN